MVTTLWHFSKDATSKYVSNGTWTDLEWPFLYSTHGGSTSVLFKPLEKARAPKKWSAWLPNRPEKTPNEMVFLWQTGGQATYPCMDSTGCIL